MKGLETSKFLGGQVIHTVKYADDLVLLANEEMILKGITDSLVGIRRCCGMENVYGRDGGNENLKAAARKADYDRQKQWFNVEYFKYLVDLVTCDASFIRGINPLAPELFFFLILAHSVYKI